jgi:DHA1 family arabinose polymer transporter-like MFS transporter
MTQTYYPHISKRTFYTASPGNKTPPAKLFSKPENQEQNVSDQPEKKKRFSIKPSLLTLTIGGFSLGMAEFMMMGVLPDVAGSLSVSIPTAGHLISMYALGVVIGAPLIIGLAGHFSPKKVLMTLMFFFGFFNLLFALAPGYELLMIARLFSGLPHGAFFGMGAVVAAKLAEPGREARAVSVMFAGLTVANLVGVPLGTFIGHDFSWRISFLIVAAFGLITALSIKKWLPSLSPEKNDGFASSLKIFTKPDPWLIIGISAIGTGGMFAWISYIAPLMTEIAGFKASSITLIMMVAGLGMAIGNFLGGRLADRYSPLKTTSSLLLLMVVSLLLVSLLTEFKVLAILMTFITGAIAFAVIAPMQMLMINAAKGAEMLASSSLQASANTGNALGAFLGGLPIAAGFSYTSPEYVGAGLAMTGFVLCMILAWKNRPAQQLAASSRTLVA